MTRTTVTIPDQVARFLEQRAAEKGTNLASEIAAAAEDAVWRARIADHDRWRRENPDVAAALDDRAHRRRSRRGAVA